MKRAMSTVKNIAAAAMTLAVFFGFAGFKPVTANAAQAAMPATASVEEENSYFEEDAYQRSFLTLINNERAQAGLAPVALGDSNHNAAAMERAEELAAEERRHQSSEHEGWLEEQIAQAFSRHDAGEGEYISNDEMESRMNALKQRATRGAL